LLEEKYLFLSPFLDEFMKGGGDSADHFKVVAEEYHEEHIEPLQNADT